MRRYWSAGILLLMLSGCSTLPFHEEQAGLIAASDPRGIAERFGTRVPVNLNALSSIVFEYGLFTASGIGYVDIDTRGGRYKVMCMNQLGVKLFEFQGDRNGLMSQYAIEPLARQGSIATAVGEDIKRIYLDLMPSTAARIIQKKRSVVFRQPSGDGVLEYEFSGNGPNLVRKTYREDHRAVWRVSYYEYQAKNEELIPMGIVFANYRYGYRLIVRHKEIRN